MRYKSAFVGFLGLLAPAMVAPAAGETAGHDAVNFTRPTYQVREGDPASVDVVRGTHGTGQAEVDVVALTGSEGGTATPRSDYDFTSDTLVFNEPIDADDTSVPTLEDTAIEPVETINLDLQRFSRGLVPAFPNDAVVSVVDTDGDTRFSVDVAAVELFENSIGDPNSPDVDIFVLRLGPVSGSSTVHYATQSGTATAGSDFTNKSGDLQFQSNEWVKLIQIPLINNTASEQDENFTFTLSDPTGATLFDPSSTEITIHDDDESGGSDTIPPYTAFHQPLQGKTYSRQEAATLLVFMQDDEFGSGMDRVQLALRKRKVDGTCTWWNGSRFTASDCDQKRWAQTGAGTETVVEYFSDTAVFTLKRLLRSSDAGSGIRNYTAFCRGWDKAGNVQTSFIKGQNKNTFEVK